MSLKVLYILANTCLQMNKTMYTDYNTEMSCAIRGLGVRDPKFGTLHVTFYRLYDRLMDNLW